MRYMGYLQLLDGYVSHSRMLLYSVFKLSRINIGGSLRAFINLFPIALPCHGFKVSLTETDTTHLTEIKRTTNSKAPESSHNARVNDPLLLNIRFICFKRKPFSYILSKERIYSHNGSQAKNKLWVILLQGLR